MKNEPQGTKGTVHRFYIGGSRNRLQPRNRIFLKLFIFSMVDSLLSQISPIVPLLLLVDHFRPIRDTTKSTVGGSRNRLQLRNRILFKRFIFFYGRYVRFYVVTDQSERGVTDTGLPFWTDP